MTMEKSRIIVRKLADDVGIFVSSCYATFPDILGMSMSRVLAELIPKLKLHLEEVAE